MKQYLNFIIWMIVAVLLCSCDHDVTHSNRDTDSQSTCSTEPVYAIEELYYDRIFKFQQLTFADKTEYINYSYHKVDDKWYFLNYSTYYQGQLSFDILDADGAYQESVPIPDTIHSNRYVLDTSEESMTYITVESVDAFSMKFVRYDSEWNFLEESPVVRRWIASTAYSGMRFVGDDLLYYADYATYWFEDGDITQKPLSPELPCLAVEISPLDDGRILVYGPLQQVIYDNEYYYLDPQTGKSGEYSFASDSDDSRALFDRARDVYYLNGELFANCDDGLFVMRDEQPVELVSWEESGIDCRVIELVQVFSDTCFLVTYENPLEMAVKELGFLRLTDEVRTKPREIFSLATIGLEREQLTFLNAVVYMFNRENSDYKIDYHNYYEQDGDYLRNINATAFITDQTKEEAQKQFEADLLSGVVYDCYVFPEVSPNRDLLADKGLLADLSPYLGEDQLLGCVETAYCSEDGVMALPYFMQLSTLMTSQSVLSSQTKLTYDVLMDIAAGLKDGEALLSERAYNNLKLTGQYEFLDVESEACSFDSAECTEWMEFLMDVKNGLYSDDTLDILHQIDNRGMYQSYASSPFVPEEVIRSDRVKFTEVSFNDAASIAAAYWLYKWENINFCGYPSEDETVVQLSSESLFSIAANAHCSDGAAAFMQFLFSEEIQSCSYMKYFGLPVTVDGMITVFPDEYIHCCLRGVSRVAEDDPWFAPHPDAFYLMLICSDEKMDEPAQDANNVFDVIKLTDDDRDLFLRFLDRAVMRTAADATLQSILDEELSYVESGVRPPEEAGKILQSRVGIYLAE